MTPDYVRVCPSCDAENAPEVMRCACGALLAGVDLVDRRVAQAAPAAVRALAQVEAPRSIVCPHEDCAQENPAGSSTCLYCNRPLEEQGAASAPDLSQGLLRLPSRLRDRYRILKPLPTQGSEAELLLVEEHSGGPTLVAKIYRHGIAPRADVQQRIARIDPAHRVEVLESGISDGYAFELMEYCVHGSLREHLRFGPISEELLLPLVRELAIAIACLHEAGLLHRDLKPENILVRTIDPLDLILTDFGASSVLDATQRFTGMARTLPYASPESLSGVIDGKADYWSLGMIILEAIQGKHPFAGLSEAVILHHLTTRNIDLSSVADRKFRKLLRGLLLRDPKERWGSGELARWLADDLSLPEPVEQGVAVEFKEPYHVGQEVCNSAEQLAVALARNWRDGVTDISNGQLLAWFRDVQKNQNAVRVLLELRYEKQISVDVQLLKFIVHLAPGLPPVWRGESIELPAILARAGQALKGDEAAALWLDKLYQYRVLEVYAAAGNQEAADIVQKWNRACDQFADAWQAGRALIKAKAPGLRADEVVNYDRMLYGSDDSAPPPPTAMHAQLLAMAYDAQWGQRLRQRLGAEILGLTAHCPWLAELGDPQTMDAAQLLVLEALLPEAGKAVKRHIESGERRRESDLDEIKEVKQEVAAAISSVRKFARRNLMRQSAADELRAELERYFELLATIKASGRSDQDWLALKKTALRTEAGAMQMRQLVDRLTERHAVNAGWLGSAVLGFASLLIIFLPLLFRNPLSYLVFVACGAIFGWRMLATHLIARRIGNLAERLML